MQYRLSTLFLIFFIVAASLALCGAGGIWISAVILFSALLLNKFYMKDAIIWVSLLIIIFGIGFAILLPASSSSHEASRPVTCINNLKQIGLALHNYHDANGHFPSANICDKNGKPLLSWRVEILPMMEYGKIYDSLNKDEPWNSPHNAKILNYKLPEFFCPRDTNKDDLSTSYIAIIGPGTAWREDGPVKLSDLPDGGKLTIMAVEVVDSGVHCAEPRDITVDEALEGLKTGKGLRISTVHNNRINILFANAAVCPLPARMPISLWKKLLAGEVKDIDNIEEQIDKSASDIVDISVYAPPYEPGKWKIILGAIVWLLSVGLLFHRALKSRPKPVKIEIAKDPVG